MSRLVVLTAWALATCALFTQVAVAEPVVVAAATGSPVMLYRHAGKVVTRDMFFDSCWGRDYMPDSRTLDQHVAHLRKRIERDPKSPRIIATVHGAGYRYQPA